MSPILVRPVREQFEHDRVIRVLQARYKRKYEVVINPGAEQNASVTVGENPMFPDLVLYSLERGRRLQGTIEVETGESVNSLEAMAEWGPFSRLRAPFVLYVPPNSLDTARRLCAELQLVVAEIWTYHTAADQVRFTMVHRDPEAAAIKPAKIAAPKAEPTPGAKPETKPVPKPEAKPAAKPDAKLAAKAEAKPAARKQPAKPSAKKAAKPARPARAAKSAKKPAAKKPAKAVKRR